MPSTGSWTLDRPFLFWPKQIGALHFTFFFSTNSKMSVFIFRESVSGNMMRIRIRNTARNPSCPGCFYMSFPFEQTFSCPAGPFCLKRWSRWCGAPWRDSSSAVSSLTGTGSSSVRSRPASPASRSAVCFWASWIRIRIH